jgi:50S ribosomal protein L16 3-hydroxylase
MPTLVKRGREPIAALGGLTAADFLRRHWQKRPLLVRQAFPAFRDPLTRDELAGLSCEPEVESRLVLERGGRRPWQVVRGPQDPARLRRLPESHWTLLLEGADQHVPALADLLDSFAFLPRWRVDDVMVSVAPDHGSVGPHIDRYDVFLRQGQGRRRWQVDELADAACRPGLDLRVLSAFNASVEWVLDPGDLLYLPPGLAHFGVAQGECLTYSIGFRAPRVGDLLLGCLERIARRVDRDLLYEDPDLEPQPEAGEIAPRALAKMRSAIEAAWAEGVARSLPRLLGAILTEPSGPLSGPRQRRLQPAQLRKRLRAGANLVREPASRASFTRRGTAADLFVDGRAYALPRSMAGVAPLLTGSRHVPRAKVLPLLRGPAFVTLVADLVNAGSFDLEPAAARKAPRAGGRAPAESPRARGSRSPGAGPSKDGGARGGRRGA